MSKILFSYCTIILIIYNHISMGIYARLHHRHHHFHNHDHGQRNESFNLNNSNSTITSRITNSIRPSTTTLLRRANNNSNINNNDTIKSLKLTLVNSYHHSVSDKTNYNNEHRWQNTLTTQKPQYANDEKYYHQQQPLPPPQQHHHHHYHPHQQQPSNQNQFSETFVWKNQHKEITSVGPTVTPRSLKDRSYTKHHAGRHVCIEHKTIPVQDLLYTSNSISPSNLFNDIPCYQPPCNNNGVRQLNPGYKDIYRHRTTKQISLNCCPGWQQINKYSNGCFSPICKMPCKNGGSCIRPETCKCPDGFTGQYCDTDRNECKEEKPCDQMCYNTEGSYYCMCRDGFQLQADKQSCRKIIGYGGDNAFEARDMENDIDYEEINVKISNIEKVIGREKESNQGMYKKMEETVDTLNRLKARIDNMENRQQELNYIKNKLNTQEVQTRKLEYIVDMLYKCRTKSSIFCPMQP